jgi:ribonuclease VapC
MIVDTSAILAVLRNEAEGPECARAMEEAPVCRISSANYLEAAIVTDGPRDAIASRRFDEFLRESRMLVEPITEHHAKLARAAYRDFGRGSGHPAKLNFGDCFAYALAKAAGEPLLFKGNDFRHTDVRVALK